MQVYKNGCQSLRLISQDYQADEQGIINIPDDCAYMATQKGFVVVTAPLLEALHNSQRIEPIIELQPTRQPETDALAPEQLPAADEIQVDDKKTKRTKNNGND